jgi:hypothetical protein
MALMTYRNEVPDDEHSRARADLQRRRLCARIAFASYVPTGLALLWLFLDGASWAIFAIPIGALSASTLYLNLFRCPRCKGRLWDWGQRKGAMRCTHCFRCDLRLRAGERYVARVPKPVPVWLKVLQWSLLVAMCFAIWILVRP